MTDHKLFLFNKLTISNSEADQQASCYIPAWIYLENFLLRSEQWVMFRGRCVLCLHWRSYNSYFVSLSCIKLFTYLTRTFLTVSDFVNNHLAIDCWNDCINYGYINPGHIHSKHSNMSATLESQWCGWYVATQLRFILICALLYIGILILIISSSRQVLLHRTDLWTHIRSALKLTGIRARRVVPLLTTVRVNITTDSLISNTKRR
jgi:hypothetical protein